MRFAIYVPCYGETYGDPAVLCDLAVEAEAAGWDGFFMWDHVVAWKASLPELRSYISAGPPR